MKNNMGKADRMIRVLIAIAVLILFWQDVISGVLAYVLIAISVIFLLTSLVSFCPLYTIFGIKTCRTK